MRGILSGRVLFYDHPREGSDFEYTTLANDSPGPHEGRLPLHRWTPRNERVRSSRTHVE